MPGGKDRLKQVFTSGEQIGANGTFHDQILAGSVSATVAGFAGTSSPSTETSEVTIANLGACDILLAQADLTGLSACVVLQAALAGAGQASLVWRYSGSGASMDGFTATVRYIGVGLG